MVDQDAPRLALLRRLARVATTASGVSLLVVAGVTTASAYTILGATFDPDHGAAGSRITVGELPLAVDCPTVDVWLASDVAPSPPIESSDDPRLIKLRGTTRHAPGGIGVGDQRLGTTFVFRVPAISPRTYGTYWQCSGGTGSFGLFSPGATTFTVDVSAPGTDTVASPADPVVGSPDTSRLVIGLFAGLVALAGVAVFRRPPDRVGRR
jgi:hypothetical protein